LPIILDGIASGRTPMIDEMPKDIVKELHIRAAIEQISGTLFEQAADEIERLRLRIKELEGLIDSAMEADYNNEYFRTHHK
jgi:hypothetical protein